MKTADCRDCHAPVVWAKSKTGSKMPFDPEPEDGPRAKWLLIEEGNEVLARFAASSSGPKWSSHFDTCEHRDERKTQERTPPNATAAAGAIKNTGKGMQIEVTVSIGDLIFFGKVPLVPKVASPPPGAIAEPWPDSDGAM